MFPKIASRPLTSACSRRRRARSSASATEPAGSYRYIAAFAPVGNDLIVYHIIEVARQTQAAAQAFDAFLVGVQCVLEELERRERVRGHRYIGEGRSRIVDDGIHATGPYDCDVDTTSGDPSDVASEVIGRWQRRSASVLFDDNSAS